MIKKLKDKLVVKINKLLDWCEENYSDEPGAKKFIDKARRELND